MWGWFDNSHRFNIPGPDYSPGRMMFMKDAKGNDVKIWLQQYYYDDVEVLPEGASASGYIEMRYQTDF